MRLTQSIETIKGVGPKSAEALRLAGIETIYDLLVFLPRRHEDFTNICSIKDLKPGNVTIKAKVESATTRFVRRGMRITTAVLTDDTSKVQAVWFNQPYRENQLKSGDEFLFSGNFEHSYNKYQLSQPSVEKVLDVPIQTDRIVPIYRSVKGLKSQLVRKLLAEIRIMMQFLPESLPLQIVRDEQLLSRAEAYEKMHFPSSLSDVLRAKERLAFEELFELLLTSAINKRDNEQLEGYSMAFSVEHVAEFVAKLPFKLTNAQRRAAWDVLQDFERPTPMNRLLQGDVGSGKTAVAAVAIVQAQYAGYQTAIMAPTEILATQHAETLSRLLSPFSITVGLLTGHVKGQARRTLYEQIKKGNVDVIIGTHALIQDAVEYNRLGFVVIDEQHRFGVKQRQALLAKSAKMPHLLAMTATPIPRSLALTVYGELDISIIDELPAGRKPIETKLWSPNSRAQLYGAIDAQISHGRQCYVICTLIDDNPDNERKSVQAEYNALRAGVFRHRRIGLLHGKMKPDEKDAVMNEFSAGHLDILVSTTVVEVGVDVPNATIIMIENADHFGLSQLHQLRGRVGRSSHQSYCFLVMSDSKKPSQRLQEIEKSNDGFYLAEVDLAARGPGEIYGRAQHGALNLQVATLGDIKLISRAQKQASQFAANNPNMVHYKELAQRLDYYRRIIRLN